MSAVGLQGVCTRERVGAGACVCAYESVCASIVCVRGCESMCVCKHCVCESMCVCIRECVCKHCVCEGVCESMCLYAKVCVQERVCVRVYTLTHVQE